MNDFTAHGCSLKAYGTTCANTAGLIMPALGAFVRARGSVLAVTLLGDAAVRHCYRGHMGGGGTKPATPALHAHLQP